jgi:hypothetical protein
LDVRILRSRKIGMTIFDYKTFLPDAMHEEAILVSSLT